MTHTPSLHPMFTPSQPLFWGFSAKKPVDQRRKQGFGESVGAWREWLPST